VPTILFLAGHREPRAIGDQMARDGRARWSSSGDLEVARPEGEGEARYRFIFHVSVSGAVAELGRTPIDLVLVDNRPDPARPYRSFAATPAGKLLPILSSAPRGVRSISRRQIVLLLATGETLARDLYVAGAMKLGGYMVDPWDEPPSAERKEGFLDQIALMLGTRRPGKLALCLSAGGIEGLIYELGALRAIDEFLVNRKLHDFDIFCGISAGAVIGAFLANGVEINDLMAGLKDGTDSIDPIGRTTLFTPNHGEIVERLGGLLRRVLLLARGEKESQARRSDLVAALLRFVPGGFFSGDPIRWYLEEQFTRPGRTNCFRQLKKELYIGATDQDSGRHVVFGEAGNRDVPISHAVRASAALVPYYPPEVIGGRYLIDGAFTRTTNFAVAIRHGARLVVIVNPFVPLLSTRPGAIHREGGAFAGLQGIKTLVHSRFDQAFVRIDETYPDVDFQVFVPEGEELAQLTGTLMKFFYRVEIADLAYEHTVARLRRRLSLVTEEFRRHGLLIRDPRETGPVALSGKPPAPASAPDVAASAS
jgi:predicted acylesterase/phospholipase RssA